MHTENFCVCREASMSSIDDLIKEQANTAVAYGVVEWNGLNMIAIHIVMPSFKNWGWNMAWNVARIRKIIEELESLETKET